VTGTIVDMHIHTLNGASDSMLDPEHLVEEAANIGLTGVNISEHDRVWEGHAMARYRADHPELFVSSGMEVSTDLGHVIVVGLREYVSGIRRCEELRRVVSEQGAYMVVAHPFRHHFDPVHFQRTGSRPFDLTPEQAVEMPVFRLVDDVEVSNSCNTPRENWFALQVARILGRPGFGGSDAHSRTGIGTSAVMFEKQLTDMSELLGELHARRYRPVQGLAAGRMRPFSDVADEFELSLAR
jgi:predicted metal-dependent phosphoesterase TrpH